MTDSQKNADPNQKPAEKPTEERVITPAGPRRKDQVHPVKPGEKIRRNPDGTFSILPDERP